MLEQVLTHIHNWFRVRDGANGIHPGKYIIQDGGIALPFLQDGQYFRICGSVFNDGLHRYGPDIESVPLLLKKHRSDVYGILSVMNERPVAEISAQKLTETMQQVRGLFEDEEFAAFFKSSAQRGQKEQSAPSADSPS